MTTERVTVASSLPINVTPRFALTSIQIDNYSNQWYVYGIDAIPPYTVGIVKDARGVGSVAVALSAPSTAAPAPVIPGETLAVTLSSIALPPSPGIALVAPSGPLYCGQYKNTGGSPTVAGLSPSPPTGGRSNNAPVYDGIMPASVRQWLVRPLSTNANPLYIGPGSDFPLPPLHGFLLTAYSGFPVLPTDGPVAIAATSVGIYVSVNDGFAWLAV